MLKCTSFAQGSPSKSNPVWVQCEQCPLLALCVIAYVRLTPAVTVLILLFVIRTVVMKNKSIWNLSQSVRVCFPNMWNDRQWQDGCRREDFSLLSIQLPQRFNSVLYLKKKCIKKRYNLYPISTSSVNTTSSIKPMKYEA